MSFPSASDDPHSDQLEWLRSAIAGFAGVEDVTYDRGPDGRELLRVRLETGPAQQREPLPGSNAIDSLLAADVAPMVVFDAETLEILEASPSAREILGLDAGGITPLSLADLYAGSELDRLGSALVAAPVGWVDLGVWEMRGRGGAALPGVKTWHGPATSTAQRLMIAQVP